MTEAIESYISRKLQPIEKFLDEASKVEIDVGKTTNHHKSGEEMFKAEFNIFSQGIMTRIEATASDLYAAIDLGQNDLMSALASKKDRKQTLWKKGAQRIKAFAQGLSKRKRR